MDGAFATIERNGRGMAVRCGTGGGAIQHRAVFCPCILRAWQTGAHSKDLWASQASSALQSSVFSYYVNSNQSLAVQSVNASSTGRAALALGWLTMATST